MSMYACEAGKYVPGSSDFTKEFIKHANNVFTKNKGYFTYPYDAQAFSYT